MIVSRLVTRTGKDKEGDIIALCHPGQNWSPRHKEDAIKDIESQLYEYYVMTDKGARAQVHVVDGAHGKYLRSNWDNSNRNNLDNLPDC